MPPNPDSVLARPMATLPRAGRIGNAGEAR